MSSTKLPHRLYLAPQTLIFLDVQQRILEKAPRLCFFGRGKASKIGIVRFGWKSYSIGQPLHSRQLTEIEESF
jgi:hypothetical protein